MTTDTDIRVLLELDKLEKLSKNYAYEMRYLSKRNKKGYLDTWS